MCTIFGIGILKDNKIPNKGAVRRIMTGVMHKSMNSNTDASGVAAIRKNRLNVLRRPVPAAELSSTKEYGTFMKESISLKKDRTTSIIGHCRLRTKGDPSNNLNNHPIVAGSIVGIHNGVISNDDDLFELNPQIDRIAQVDTEIIFQLVNMFFSRGKSTVEAIKETCSMLRGSFACALLNAQCPSNLFIFRAMINVSLLLYKDYGIVAFATIPYTVKETMSGITQEEPVALSLPRNSGTVLDLNEGSISTFSLKQDVKVGASI